MTRYELALSLLEDIRKLGEKVFVRDYDGTPSDNLFIQRYNDVVLLTVPGWRNPYPETPIERKNMYKNWNIELMRNILEDSYRKLYDRSCTASGQPTVKNAFEKIIEGLAEMDLAVEAM